MLPRPNPALWTDSGPDARPATRQTAPGGDSGFSALRVGNDTVDRVEQPAGELRPRPTPAAEGGGRSFPPTTLPAALRPFAAVDGWPINVANQTEAVTAIVAAAAQAHGFSVCTLNLDHLVKLRGSAEFRAAYRRADFVTADGAPVVKLARRQFAGVERTTGADLLLPLARAAAAAGLPVYLFGARSETLAAAIAHLESVSSADLQVVGSGAPSPNFEPAGAEADAAIEQIRSSGARLCFVALGAPKQEIFAARALDKGVACGFVSIGAAFDFLVGTQTRAPAVLQRCGLEWTWRLASNPRRLAVRYARCAALLAEITVLSAMGFGVSR